MSGTGTNKVALVTGGARGIGRACALALAKTGHDIVLVDLLVPEMERTAGEIGDLGRAVAIFDADVTSFGRAQEVVDAAKDQFGRIDFLLNNAGKAMPKGILDITEEEFDRTIAINLKSCFNYVRAVAPLMLEQGAGRIASMSSLNALSGGVTAAVSRFAYASAKAGILGMTRSLAKELGPAIHVNAICPGLIQTELGNAVTRARGPEIAARDIALRRLGTPDDIAQLVVFLATSEPCFITGQTFTVDGFHYNC
ncbi:SDR family NAD(P)-dependent oxidoreductase [Bosea sp. PAMC 26642]|uniref:SDR family NAD(P)-dependent oxidoreductase n=1 Tax=Bosea sp. (strain PAMC 26642) TaxID=1792307 RepID=UPI00077000C9|nr:SDR family NAD(P)-dependent oxidoreductase [Bosea sp. PAMC 26642]AMJ59737.1 short-chain dehydrogenase [Bosea sp. PAMC 26642]